MSDNVADTAETHSIEANDDLVRSVIVDQTDNIEKGWREALQNIIDSDASEGRLKYDHSFTLVADDGSGVDLTEQKGLDLLTVMGESSKSSDNHESIGEFGIGKGQIIAKGRTVFFSGDTALMFDIKGWGLEAKTVPMVRASEFASEYDEEWADLIEKHFKNHNSYNGLAVLVDHYEEEVPEEDSYKWDTFEDNLKNRFQYLNAVDDTKLYLNGDLITAENAQEVLNYGNPMKAEVYESEETGRVHIGVRHGKGTLTVYSGGIKVCNVNSRGIQGHVVTDRNLRLNFARNEIKSGCPVWNAIEDRLNDIRAELFEDYEKDLNKDARQFIAEQMFNRGEIEKYSDIEAFQTASEDLVSWNEISDRDEIGFASNGNPAADKLEEFGEIVLDTHDAASEKIQEELDEIEDAPSEYDAQERAENEGIHTSYETVDQKDLQPTQEKQLGIARYIVEMIDGVDMEVYYGESDVANAWTDGSEEIHITDTATPSSTWIQWVPEIWRIIMHELAHNAASKEEPGHGMSFNRRYRELIDNGGGKEALSELMGKIDEETVSEIAERGHMTHIDEFATV